MWLRLKSYFFWRQRAVRAHLFGVNGRRLPKPGDMIYWCGDGSEKCKKVIYISCLEDTIEYEDGSDSIFHCAWSWHKRDEP